MTPFGMFGSDQVRDIEVWLGSPINSVGGEEAADERNTSYHIIRVN